MPFWTARRATEERLIWSRDRRFITRLAADRADARLLELDSGWCLIAPALGLSDSEVAVLAGAVPFGLVSVDQAIPERERYVYALASAVQQSGIANRIGMDQSPLIVQTKMLDYFFALLNATIHFQPIVDLHTWEAWEYECLTRPGVMRPQVSVGEIVDAAVATGRTVEFDLFVVNQILTHADELAASAGVEGPIRLAINLLPTSLLDPHFEARELARRVREAGLSPHQITLECTEQQAIPDVKPLRRQVRALRRLGFGFAVDDAGAGYASFSSIAALRPSVIKIDRQIVYGVNSDEAKQALVEAFVSFGRRIGAHLVAEGIENRRDLVVLIELGVEYGQGYLLGRPAAMPVRPRRIPEERLATAKRAIKKGFVGAGAGSGFSGSSPVSPVEAAARGS